MSKEKKPQMPKGDRFTCRICRHKHDTATEHAGDRVCVECANKPANPPTASTGIDPAIGVPSGEFIVVRGVPMQGLLPAQPPARPKPLPFEDASIIAELEEPQSFPLEHLLRERIAAKMDADYAKTRIDHYNSELLPFFKRNKMSGVMYDGSMVAVMTGKKPTIKKDLLLNFLLTNGFTVKEANAGVKQCTVEKEFETVAVRGPKEEKEEVEVVNG